MFATLGYYICVPFAFLTRLFYSWTGSYGVALILFTLVVKLVLLPFQLKSKKSMLRMNRMQGKLNDIKTRYANNQQKKQEAMAELYAKEGINPMSGCLWSFIPFPILIALYYIIRVPMRYFMGLSETVIAEITTLAGSLGFTVADGSQVGVEASADGVVSVTLPAGKAGATVRVYSLDGRLVKSAATTSGAVSIDCGSLKGCYLVNVGVEGKTVVKKIVF